MVHVGPVSSLHDRVCELYYRLKGGSRIDYGEIHSERYGHDRYGSAEPVIGLYPEWDERNPLHLVCHSYGGCTALLLQHYFSIGYFDGAGGGGDGGGGGDKNCKPTAQWIRSITTISSPLRGATTPYLLGASLWPSNTTGSGGSGGSGLADAEEIEGLAAALADRVGPVHVHTFSPGWFLSRFIHFWELCDIRMLKPYLSFELSHWKLSWRHGIIRGVKRFLCGFYHSTDLLWTEDNAAIDLCVHAMNHHTASLTPQPKTYYRSYATRISRPAATAIAQPQFPASSKATAHHHRPTIGFDQISIRALPLLILSFLVGRFSAPPTPAPPADPSAAEGGDGTNDKPEAQRKQKRKSVCESLSLGSIWRGVCSVCDAAMAVPRSIVQAVGRSVYTSALGSGWRLVNGSRPLNSIPAVQARASVEPPAPIRAQSQRHLLGGSFTAAEWWCNDGCVSTASQYHPHAKCSTGECDHAMAVPLSLHTQSCVLPDSVGKPGSWQVLELADCNHVEIVPFPRTAQTQHRFFSHLWSYLDRIDAACTAARKSNEQSRQPSK